MPFRDDATREAAALVEHLRSAWSDHAVRQLETLRNALDVTEAALRAGADREKGDDADSLVERLDQAATAGANAAAHEASAAAQVRIDALTEQLRETSAERTQLERIADRTRAQVEALESSLAEESRQLAVARDETAQAHIARDQVEAERRDLERALQEATTKHAAAQSETAILAARVEALEFSLAKESGQLAAARDDLAQAYVARDHVEAERRDLERLLLETTDKHAAARSQLDDLGAELEGVRAACASLTSSLEAEKVERANVVGDLDASRRLQQETDAARRQLEAELRNATARAFEIERRLAEELTLRRELHTRLDEVMTNEATSQQRLTEAVKRESDNLAQLAEAAAHLSRVQGQLEAERAANGEFRAAIDAAEKRMRGMQTAAQNQVRTARTELEAALREEQAKTADLVRQLEIARERPPRSADGPLLGRIRRVLQALDWSDSLDEMLDVLLDQLAVDFARVALFVACDNRLEGKSSRGLSPTIDIKNVAMPLSIASPLTRAVLDRQSCVVEAHEAASVFGGPICCALAMPLVADDRVIAVAYVEQPEAHENGFTEVAQHVAQILTDHASRRIPALEPANSPTPRSVADTPPQATVASAEVAVKKPKPVYPGPARQTERFRVPDGVTALLDGTPSTLVDVSRAGVQILSTQALRPNQRVRLQLPKEGGTVPCMGRVIWALFELPSPQAPPRYRSGILFTEVDVAALDAFLARYVRVNDDVSRAATSA
jgi:chromosome segregation ATPase